jgi:hypothetical protein
VPRIVPSQIVSFLNNSPFSKPPNPHEMSSADAAQLHGLLKLLDEVPEELLPADPKSYGQLVCSKERVRIQLESEYRGPGPFVSPLLHEAGAQIFQIMSSCPDQAPAPTTSQLNFITDTALRDSLRVDISAVERALSNGEWKGATVLAGSVIEALLLWALGQRPSADIDSAKMALLASGKLTRQPDLSLERWDLHEFTEVAANLGIIGADTYTETRLAREFRNLIHPGRAQRLGKICDRGTALSCSAALDHVVRDLS